MMNVLMALPNLLVWLMLVPAIVVNCLLAAGVNRETARLRTSQVPLYALDRTSWILVVLLSGIFGFATFWLIHHSALRHPGPAGN